MPVRHSRLTLKQAAEIEGIQKVAMKLTLKENYGNYPSACETFSITTLAKRRVKLCKNFTEKNVKSDNSFFTKIQSKTRNKKPRVYEPKCIFGRYKKSSLPYLASLFNAKSQ